MICALALALSGTAAPKRVIAGEGTGYEDETVSLPAPDAYAGEMLSLAELPAGGSDAALVAEMGDSDTLETGSSSESEGQPSYGNDNTSSNHDNTTGGASDVSQGGSDGSGDVLPDPSSSPSSDDATDDSDIPSSSRPILSADVLDARGNVIYEVVVEPGTGDLPLPDGTSLDVALVGSDDVSDREETAVADALLASEGSRPVSWEAIDVSVLDADGDEMELGGDARVTISSADGRIALPPVAVRVENTGHGSTSSSPASRKARGKSSSSPSPEASVVEPVSGQADGTARKPAARASKSAATAAAATSTPTPGASDDVPKTSASYESEPSGRWFLVSPSQPVASVDEHDGWSVSVEAGAEAGLAGGTSVSASELSDDDDQWDDCVGRATSLIGDDDLGVRAFDISLVSPDGSEAEPFEGTSVSVTLSLGGPAGDTSSLRVVHLGDDGRDEEVSCSVSKDSSGDGVTVSFAAESFSIYSVVQAGEPYVSEVKTVGDIAGIAGRPLLLSVTRGSQNSYYFSSSVNGNGAFVVSTDQAQAAMWYLEPVEGTTDRFYVYTMVDGQRRYMRQQSAGSNLMTLSDTGTPFVASATGDGRFRLKHASEERWLQYSNGGGGIRLYQTGSDMGNVGIVMTDAEHREVPDDPYGLDGRTYYLLVHMNDTTAAAMMAGARNASSLYSQAIVIRENILDADDPLYVAADADCSPWTFEGIGGTRYYVTSVVDGTKKYLRVTNSGLSLVDEPDEYCELNLTSGSGVRAGKIHLTNKDGRSPNLTNGTAGGFGVSGQDAETEWLSLAVPHILEEDDFVVYSAQKVSVSDLENMPDGAQVVMYVRVWNESQKGYEHLIINYDGSVIKGYESGGSIKWTGLSINTTLWDFTEYHWEGTNDPNYYYELQNAYSGFYLSPAEDDILSSATVGVNLNGRRYGEYGSTIIAWDDERYAYSGIKYEDGRIVSCAMSESDIVYFAVLVPVTDDDTVLHTVDTLDNDAYGITMRMVDFNGPAANSREATQTAVMGESNYVSTGTAGLVSTDLDDHGYPVSTKAGRSLHELFASATPVNRLFSTSTYEQGGYFTYDSTQNFAHLNDDGTFTVYDRLVASGSNNGVTRTHGQFFPYNDIDPTKIAPYTNQTDVLGMPLPDSNPRKGEVLYWLEEAETDYFFGMEMDVPFIQSADGLDDYGHDIIFEFSGDDDFWLYVDGELVLDLGGIHNALTGNINFKTGQIQSGLAITLRTASGTRQTKTYTLREVFESNYRTRNPQATESEVAEFLAKYFDEGSDVFKDYTSHTMQMFYMERGAGASNLRLRFNTSTARRGTFVMSKVLSGVDNATNSLIRLPYQIWYEDERDASWHLLGEVPGETDLVTYAGTANPAAHMDSYTPAGDTTTYEHVFLMRPGDRLEVELPSSATGRYKVRECAVNPDIYDDVRVNGGETEGEESGERLVHDTPTFDTAETSSVTFDNHVREGAMQTLSITKVLYDSDGSTVLTRDDDSTGFGMRLRLGDEQTDESDIPLADLYVYYVRDEQGSYCQWDADEQGFVSLGITDYADLVSYCESHGFGPAETESVAFRTSMNGSISKIPAGYTVEVRDLIVGTRWGVEERDYEVPKGYTQRVLDGYEVGEQSGGHISWEATYDDEAGECLPPTGIIEYETDAHARINNQRGWGLTAEKSWTDRDFVTHHGDAYFGLFLDGELVDGTLTALRDDADSVYWFLDDLRDGQGTIRHFSEYEVRECDVRGAVVDEDGIITSWESLRAAQDGTWDDGEDDDGEGDGRGDEDDDRRRVTIYGCGDDEDDTYSYEVSRTKGQETGQNENIRTDRFENSRPGVAFYKTDFEGHVVPGATFVIEDAETGETVGKSSYVADETGLITTAYLPEGDYKVVEVSAPEGFSVLEEPLLVSVSAEGVASFSGLSSRYYTVVSDGEDGTSVTVHVRDTPASLTVSKVDGETGEPMEGVAFSLYHQRVNSAGELVRDYLPMEGFEEMVTDEDGTLAQITLDALGVGTYYLHEVEAPAGYAPLDRDIRLTIGEDGVVSISGGAHADWLSRSEDANGNVSYQLTLENVTGAEAVAVRKVDAERGNPAFGAVFDLYEVGEDGEPADVPSYAGLTSDADGWLSSDGVETVTLPYGDYLLVEVMRPVGYEGLDDPVSLTVSASGVSYDGPAPVVGGEAEWDEDAGAYVVVIPNTPRQVPLTGIAARFEEWWLVAIAILGMVVFWVARRREKRPRKGQGGATTDGEIDEDGEASVLK